MNPQNKIEKSSPAKKPSKITPSALEKMIEGLQELWTTEPKNIVSAIKTDHDSLRNYMDLLKDTDAEMTERKRAYGLFSALLKSHSTVEESVVYQTMLKKVGKQLHVKVTEGYVEHQLADDLMKRIEKAKTPVEWSAHANVLSEIVEHHIKEEESDLLPLVRKSLSAKEDKTLLNSFLEKRAKTQKKVTKNNAGVVKKSKR
jgi:hemerythrin-like domain-containing protein